jgi:hypothetical protein
LQAFQLKNNLTPQKTDCKQNSMQNKQTMAKIGSHSTQLNLDTTATQVHVRKITVLCTFQNATLRLDTSKQPAFLPRNWSKLGQSGRLRHQAAQSQLAAQAAVHGPLRLAHPVQKHRIRWLDT